MTLELRLTIDEAAAARAIAVLDQIADQAANVDGALRNVGEALLAVTQDRFAAEQDPSGGAWEPLASLTQRIRGAAGPILSITGRLRSSISYQVGGGILRLGPNTIDAAVHQFGATIRPKGPWLLRIPVPNGRPVFARAVTIPARPYIGFGPRDEEAARIAVEEWLEVEDSP